jgi:hypothetical protein
LAERWENVYTDEAYGTPGKHLGTLSRALLKTRREAQPQAEALALLRELNDALAIPGWLQPRVDAVLDRAEAGPDFNQERNAHADTIASEHDSKLECLSKSDNCRRWHPAAVNCCALYEQYAKTSPQEEKK